MRYSFRVCQNCSDKGHFGLAMDRRKKLMGHMAIDLMVVTGRIEMTRTKVGCYEKSIECLDDNDEPRVLQGKQKATLDRMVTSMQAKHSCRKVCVLFAMHISSEKGKEDEDAKVHSRYPVLHQFQDVFPVEISKFPPHMEVEFSIDLVPEAAPTSKTPYRMSTPELVELKL
eukprot:PITA_13192